MLHNLYQACPVWLDYISPASVSHYLVYLISVLSIWWCLYLESVYIAWANAGSTQEISLLKSTSLSVTLLHLPNLNLSNSMYCISGSTIFAFQSLIKSTTSFLDVSSSDLSQNSSMCRVTMWRVPHSDQKHHTLF